MPADAPLAPADLTAFAEIPTTKAYAMIEDAWARALRIAPCLRVLPADDDAMGVAKAILRDVVLRKHESGSGAIEQVTHGPFGMSTDTRQGFKAMFLPSEIEELQKLCSKPRKRAYSTDLMPPRAAPSVWEPWP